MPNTDLYLPENQIINNSSGKVRPQPGAENKRVQTVREQKVA